MVIRPHFWKIAFPRLTHWKTGVYQRTNVRVNWCSRNWANQLVPLTRNWKLKSNNCARHNENICKYYVWHERSAHIFIMWSKLNIVYPKHFRIWHKRVPNYSRNSSTIRKRNAVSPKMANFYWMPWTFLCRRWAHCAIKPSKIHWLQYDNMK